jgi:filamentous hemagglutinin family protein
MRFGAPGLAAYKAQEEAATRGVDFQIKQKTLAGLPNKQLLDESNLLDKVLDRFKGQVPNIQTPEAVAEYVRQTYADPILGPYGAKLKPLEQALTDNLTEFNANPDKWRTLHTNVSGLQILQATMPKPQVAGGNIVNMNPVSGQVGAPIAGAPPVANLATNLLIPGPNGTLVPNTALINVKGQLAAAGRPAGNTVVMPPLEKSESQEKGKLNVKAYGVIADTADRARKILPALETSETILNNGFKTGFGTDVQTQAARVLSVLGVPEADKYATDSQLFLAQGRQALLQRQLEQKGTQSEGDAQRISQTFIQLGNTPEANKFLVATAKAQAKQDIERQKFYSDWWSKSKTYEGAEEAWLAGTGGKSLFDRPEMKSFASKTPQSDISSAAAAELERRKGKPR